MGPTLLLLCALIAYSSAGPIINSETCSRHCTDSRKFGYVPGQIYEYDYTTDVDTTVQGASEEKAGIKMTAKVYIDVVSKCEMKLRVGNVRLQESDPNAPGRNRDADTNGEFRSSLEASPLAFSFQDGRIEELCTSVPEKSWVLNIKRGILSSLQNTMTDLTQDQEVQETDVTGVCKAAYQMTNNGWYSRTIKKNKDLLACTDRQGYNTVMQGTPYRIASEIQSLPIVKSTHECTQDISKEGILKSSVCEEEHVFRAFSRESSGAVTKTKQSLKYVTERIETLQKAKIVERLPLTFAHSNDGRGSTKDVERKLKDICISTAHQVKPDTPKLFIELVHLMKALDSEDMRQTYERIQRTAFCQSNQERVRKFFLDALPMIGTRASLKMMVGFIKSKEVTGIEADMWLTTLSLIKDPSKDMLMEVKPLLSAEVNGKAMLGVSSLINAYCRQSSCENDNDIASMVSSMEDTIGVGCFIDKDNLNKVIIALRSLGNAGYVQNALSIIGKCINKKDNPTEVRLAAIQAFRRMPCSLSRDDVLAVFKNRDEDSELRINAYLSLITCPSDVLFSRIKFMLESEEVNQVGSFVWSHLTNLMETSSRMKQEIKSIIGDERLKKEFNLAKLKYSRNYEGSFFLEKLNTGASIDSNVIWSSKSFLPRSAMTNITFDLFGHSVNLLEIGGRIEGLEYFLESYFGPNGYFQKDETVEPTKQTLKGISNTKMDNIDRQFGSEMEALKGDLYMRVFGNELLFTRFTGLPDGKSINIQDILANLAQNKKYTFTQNYMFFDSSIIIPTISGLPLNLTVDGSATVDLEASGKMDFRKLPSLSINGHIKPSGSVQVNSMMSVDAFVTKSGMKMVSTMHSSTSIDGHVELANGKVLRAQLKTPFDKMEIFNVKTAFFTVHRESEREQKMITDNRKTKTICSGDKLSEITGLELCGELQYPNASLKADAPYFPMTGPVSAGITLYKRDRLSSYNLEYRFVREKREARARVAFSTPGSMVDRELSFDFLYRPDPMMEIVIISPWKKASVRGAVVGDNKQKQITGRILIDNKKEYSLTAEWARSRKGQLFKYTPYIEVVIPDNENIKLSSTIEHVVGKSFDGECTLKGLSKQPIQAKVNIITKRSISSLKTSISFEAGKEYSLETRLQQTITKKATKLMPFLSVRSPTEELAAFGGSLEYKKDSLILIDLALDRLLDQPVKLYTKLTKSSRKSSSRFQTKIDLRTPVFRTKGSSNIVVQKSAIVTRTSFDYVIPRISRDKITANSKINYGLTKSLWSLKGSGSVIFKRNSDYNVAFKTDLSNKKRLSNVNFDLQYGPKKKDVNKRIFVTSLVRHELGWKASDIDIDAEVQHLASGVDLKIKGSHSHNQKSIDSNIGLVHGRKQSVVAALKIKNKSKRYTVVDGKASLKWNDKEFSLANSFEQKNKRRFKNEITSNIAGYKTNVISDLKLADDEYGVSTDINMAGRKPIHVEGQINLDSRDFRVRSQINKDYIASFGSQYKKSNLLKLSGDVTIPSRRVLVAIEAKKKDPMYSGLFDIKWDANADKNKQMFINGELAYKNTQDIVGSLLARSPLQNNKINIFRKDENVHFDIKSYGKEKASVDAHMKQKTDGNQNQILTGLTIQTAYRKLRYVKVGIDHTSDENQYKTNLDINWKPTNKVSAVISFRKPFSLRQLHGSINLKTPVKGYQSSTVEIEHDLTDELKSVVKVQVNKQYVQIDGTAKQENDVYLGHGGIKSTIPSIRAISMDISKKNKGQTNGNNMILNVNGKVYKYEGELTHYRSGMMIQQNGRVLIATPNKKYESSWRHRNTLNDVTSEINSNLNGDVYSLNLNGKHSISWGEANIQYTLMSTTPAGKGKLSVSHAHKDKTFDTTLSISRNSRNLFSSEGHVKLQTGEVATTGIVLYKNKKVLSLDSTLKMGDTKAFDIVVSTSLSSFERLRLDSEIIGNRKSFTSKLTVEVQPLMGKVQLLSTLNTIEGISGNVKIITPLKQLPTSEVTFSHGPEGDKMKTDIRIEYLPSKVVSLTSNTLFKGRRIAADIIIATPYEKLRRFSSGIEHTPTTKGFITEMKVEYPAGKSYSVAMTNEYKKNYLSSIVIRRPDSDPITASVTHKGTLQQFASSANLQYDKDSKHKADLTFAYGRKSHGLFSLKSPLTKDITASFSHSGKSMNLNSKAMFKYGQNKPLNINMVLMNAKRLKGTFKMTSPFMDDLTALLVHKGKPDNFKSKAKLSWGKKEEIEGDLAFSFTKNLRADVTISTPFKSFRKISGVIKHDGSIRNFKCQSEIKIGKTIWNANIKSKLDPTISTELVIRTPHRGYENMRAAYTHDGRLANFLCQLELSKNKEEIRSDLKFVAQPFQLSTSLQTPFKSYRNLKAVATHRGSLTNFETKTELTYSDSKTISFEALANTQAHVSVSVSLKTPFRGYEDLSAKMTHSGSLNNFASKLETIYGKERSQADVSFTSLGPVEGKLTLKTTSYDRMTIHFTHTLEPSLKTRALVAYGTKPVIDGSIILGRKPVLKGKITVKSSFARDIIGSFEHDGSILNCKSNIKAAFGKKTVEGNMVVNNERGLQMTMDIRTPFDMVRSAKMVLSHSGPINNFQTTADVELNEEKAQSVVKFSTQNSIEGYATLTSSFDSIRNAELSFKHTGHLRNFECNGEYLQDGKKVEGKLAVQAIRGLNVRGFLKTPYTKDIVLRLNHDGRLRRFQSSGEIRYGYKTASTQLSVDTFGVIKMDLSLKSPYSNNIRFNTETTESITDLRSSSYIEYSGQKQHELDIVYKLEGRTVERIQTSGEVTYNGKKISAKANLITGNKYEKIEMNVEIDTPFSGKIAFSGAFNGVPVSFKSHADLSYSGHKQHDITVDFNHRGTLREFSTDTNVIYNNKRMSAEIRLDSNNGIDGRIVLVTPFTNEIILNVNQQGQLLNFRANADVTYSGSKQHDVMVKFEHQGTMQSFSTSSSGTYNGKMTSGDISFDSTNGIEGKVTLKTPITEDIIASFNQKGQLLNSRIEADLTYSGRKQHSVAVNIMHKETITTVDVIYNGKKSQFRFDSTNGIDGEIVLKTPVTEDIILSFNQKGPLLNSRIKADLTYSGRKQHSIAATFKHEGTIRSFSTSTDVVYNKKLTSGVVTFDSANGIEGKVVLKTPVMEDIVFAASQKGTMLNFRVEAELSYKSKKQHVFDVRFQHTGTMKSFSTSSDVTYNDKKTSGEIRFDFNNGIDTKVDIKTPFTDDITLTLNQNGQMMNFGINAELTYSGRKQHEVSIAFNHDGSLRKFITSSDVSYNKKQLSGAVSFDSTNGIQAKATLNSPITKNIIVFISHSGEIKDFDNLLEVQYGGEKIHVLTSNLKYKGQLRKFSLSGSISYNSRRASMDVSLDTVRNPEGSFTLRTPFTNDIAASFTHQGKVTNFISKGQLEYGGSKRHEVNIAFQNLNNRKFAELVYNSKMVSAEATFEKIQGTNGKFILKTSYTDDISLAFEHSGEALKFNARGDLTYSGKKQHEVLVSLEHAGELTNFRTSCEATYNGKKISSEVEFDATNGIKTKGILRTPFTNDMELSVDHQGKPTDFKSHLDLSYGGSKKHDVYVTFKKTGTLKNIELSSELNYNTRKSAAEVKLDARAGLQFEGKLSTPLTEDIIVVVDHRGNLKKFESRADISYSGIKQHEMALTFNHEGTPRKFKTSLGGEYNSKPISFVLAVDSASKLSGNVLLQTPLWSDIQADVSLIGELRNFNYRSELVYSGIKRHNIEGSFNINGELRNFIASAKGSYNDKEISADISLDTERDITGQLTIKTPFSNDVTLSVTQKGSLKNFESDVQVFYLGKKQHHVKGKMSLKSDLMNVAASGLLSYNDKEIATDITLDTSNGVDVKVEIKTSSTEDIIGIIKHTGNIYDLDTRAELTYSGKKQHELTCTIKHTGGIKNLRSFTELTYNGKRVSSDISLDLKTNSVEGNIILRSPFKNMKASISHKYLGVLRKFQISTRLGLNDKEVNMAATFNSMNGIIGKVILQTPCKHYERSEAFLTYTRDNSNVILKANVSVGKYKSQINSKVETSNGIKSELCIKTPFTKDFEVIFNINGKIHSFLSESSVSYGSQRVKAIIGHEWSSRKFKGSILIETPVLEDIRIEYDINGNLRSFESNTRAFIGNMNGIKEMTRLRIGDNNIELDSTITTTLTGSEKSSQLVVSHRGSLSDFNYNMRALTGDKEIKLETSFKISPSISGSFLLQTPFTNLRNINGKLEHSGSIKSFTSSTSLQYAPDKKIEVTTKVNFRGLNRAYLNINIQSPCKHVPNFSWRYRHNVRPDIVSSSTYIALDQNKPILSGEIKMTSEIMDFMLKTPNNKYTANGDLKIQSGIYNLNGNAARNSDKFSLKVERTPSSFTGYLGTPLKGFERTQIRASASEKPRKTSLNIQASYMEEIDFEIRLEDNDIRQFDGLLLLKTGFSKLKNVRIAVKNEEITDGIKTRIESVLNQDEGVVIDASVSLKESKISLTTPWSSLRELEAHLDYELHRSKNHITSSTTMKINKKTLYDVDFKFDAEQLKEISLVANVNQPKQMRFEISKLGTAETFILANWNKNDRDSSCRLDSKFNEDWSSNKQIVQFRGICGTRSYGLDASYKRKDNLHKYSISASKDDIRTYGINIETGSRSDQFQLQLPARTLMLSLSEITKYGSEVAESSFFWDADRDQEKRITIRNTRPRGSTDEMSVELEMPSIGKDLKLDTHMRFGKGNVIYDGRTEFKYSKDTRKTLTLSSKLEDVSGRGEKYNFLLGIRHPYTTVDVQTKAEFEKSSDRLLAGFDIKYMTARRQTKNFALMTEIDRLRRQLNVQIRSPENSIKIDANVDSKPYKLSVRSMFDDTKPMNTELIVDPSQASVDFNMNYDIDNPKNTLHVDARLSNEQGITAELFREENDRKIVDSLLNIRLKTSKILHTRIQWRPSIIRDLKAALTQRVDEYSLKTGLAIERTLDDIRQEISYKKRIFRAKYNEDVKPFTDATREKLRELQQLRQSNDYYLGDIYDSAEAKIIRIVDMVEEFDEAWNRCPLKRSINKCIEQLQQLEQDLNDYSRNSYIKVGEHLNSISSNSYKTLTDSLNYVKNHQTVTQLKSKYHSYMNHLQNMKVNDQLSNVANRYTSTIYNIREKINSNLINTLPAPVYGLGSSAYKSWEIEENIQALVDKIVDEIKKDLSKEMTVIKDVVAKVLKSKVKVYDVQRGEIEIDFYLPIDVRSFSDITEISVRKYIPSMKHLLPKSNMLGSLEDYIPHMSLTGHAKIDGEHFITFDGQKFDFSGRCSYILARDFVDGNFSIILNYLGRQNRKLIVTSHHQNVQLAPNGKVRVDGILMDLPYKSSELAVFSEDDKVIIDGDGYQVKSDKNVNQVDIDLSKWYFGKTGGLLGTLNHERYDDMIMPNKQITTDPFTLGNAWQVQERCR